MQPVIRFPFGSPAVYHHPCSKASTSSRGSFTAAFEESRDADELVQTDEASAERRAIAALPPVASTMKRAESAAPFDSVRRHSSPRCSTRREAKFAGSSFRASFSASVASMRSNDVRSTCQPVFAGI